MKQRMQKIERWEKYLPDAAVLLTTAALFAARLCGGYVPFALGVLAAAGGGRHGLAALLGAALGAPLFLDFSHALRSLAVAVLLFTANNAFCETRWYRARRFLPVMTALMFLAVEFVYLTQSSPDEAAQCLVSAALTVLAALAAREATEPSDDTAPHREAARLLLLIGLLTAAASLRFENGFAPARALTMLLVLLLAYDRASELALATALAAGLAMDLSSEPLAFLHTAVYAFGALAVTPERRARRVGAALLWCAALVLLALPLSAETGLVLLYEGLLAALAFLLLPTRLFAGRRLAPTETPTPTETNTARRRLSETALALREIYESLMRTPRAGEENPAMLYDRAAERVCRGCSLRTLCWERDYAKTYNALNDATAALLERGRARGADFPSYFADRCIRFPSFLAAVNAELNAFLLRRQYRDRLADARWRAAGQYAQLSELLDGTAHALDRDGAVEAGAAQTLLDYRVGTAWSARAGERVSGDTSAVFETPDASLCLLLSDGMGCGEDARRASSMTVRLLERFLRAGVETTAALKTLNGALTLRAELEGGFATVDLLTLSLRDATAQVYKYGAAPSYLKRGSRVRRITCSCLPAGLQEMDAPPERTGLRLERRSFLVLLSDGVADGTDDAWLMKSLADFTGDDPQSLADALLAESRRVRGTSDDALVLVLYLPDGASEV